MLIRGFFTSVLLEICSKLRLFTTCQISSGERYSSVVRGGLEGGGGYGVEGCIMRPVLI